MVNPARRTQAAKELTARELTKLTGMTRRTVNYWLAGRTRPSPLARAILQRLGIKQLE
jgi:transcriptional regulator with XRE-family HTH domain